MTAATVELLTRPPETGGEQQVSAHAALAPDTVEYVADTDTLLANAGQRAGLSPRRTTAGA